MQHRSPPDRRRCLALLAGAPLLALGGCNEGSPLETPATARISAPGVPVALASLEGVPDSVYPNLAEALMQAARERDILITDLAARPRYRIRGYLSAHDDPAAPGRTEVAWSFDLFDGAQQRARRVSGAERISGSAADAWTLVNAEALRRVAGAGMNEIAAFLAAAPTAATPPTRSGA
jgi:hypothetical protein